MGPYDSSYSAPASGGGGGFNLGSLLPAAAPILGGLQTLVGAFLPKGPRPKWTIPGSASEGLALARQQANANVRPGNQIALDQIAKTGSSQVSQINRTAGSGAQALSALGKVEQLQNQSVQQNNQQNAAYQFNASQNLQNTLGKFAQLQREKFIKNAWEPYQERVQTKQALIGSGLQNIFGGLNMASQNAQQSNLLSAIYGRG